MRVTITAMIVAGALLLGTAFTGCNGGGSASSANQETQSPPPVQRTLSWAPPTAFQDNTPLDPARDLSGYNIYIKKSETAVFTDNDVECAIASPTDRALDLMPVCRFLGYDNGTYHVSVRAIAKNGLMSDFSPSASFTLTASR
jgi:hypothetical protein